jgi:hypothetical protein
MNIGFKVAYNLAQTLWILIAKNISQVFTLFLQTHSLNIKKQIIFILKL